VINKKIQKGLIIAAIAIAVLFVLIISIASPIGKRIIETYVGPTVLGRHIKTDWVYVNPFTGYVHISGLKIYECGGDSITILRADALNVHYNILKTLTKTYEFTDAELVRPVGYIIQDHKLFNFTDLIIHFSPKHPQDSMQTGPKVRHPAHINVLNFKITDGEFHYQAKSIPVNYYFKHVNISSPGKWWARDPMNLKVDMVSGCGTGHIHAEGFLDLYSQDYSISANIRGQDMQILEQYMRELANYASLRGTIDARIKASGNFKDRLALHTEGSMEVTDFHLGKSPTQDIAAWDKLTFSIHDLTPRVHHYYFDSIAIHHPYFLYERYDYLDNLRNMFGAKGEKMKAARADKDKFNLIIEIEKYVEVLVKNFLETKQYRLDHFNIYNGNLTFNDYALREKFYIGADPFFIHADSIYSTNPRLSVSIRSALKPHGTLTADLSVNPATYQDFDLHYHLLRTPVALFNPYLITYTSFPLDRGIIEFNGTTVVRSNIIHSDNHLLVLDTRVAKKVKKDDTKWIPLPLIMSIVRSPGNAIDISIPIAGNLSSPHFKIGAVITQIIKNILIKPPFTPYIAHAKAIEDVVEKSLSVKWELRSGQLSSEQEKSVSNMADFLKEYPATSLEVSSIDYVAKEKEYILLYEAKKKYFITTHKQGDKISKADSLAIDKMSVKDSGFVHYLTAQSGVELMYSVQEKCGHLLGNKIVDDKFAKLDKERRDLFLSFFKANGTEARVKFIQERNIIPFNGYSYYKLEYRGDKPEKLLKAYDELVAINNMKPRQKYAAKRKAKAGLIIDDKQLKGKN
jgi:hypothetical protein